MVLVVTRAPNITNISCWKIAGTIICTIISITHFIAEVCKLYLWGRSSFLTLRNACPLERVLLDWKDKVRSGGEPTKVKCNYIWANVITLAKLQHTKPEGGQI